MSKGLRNFNNFLTNEFALGKAHVNLYKNDNDVYIHIPILENNDIFPFGCGLIYNNDGTTLSPSLGKGFVPSFLFFISKANDTFTIKFADRFEITYTKDESDGCYVNTFDNSFIRLKNSQISLYVQGGHYLFDIDGNNDITGNWYYPVAFVDSYDNAMVFIKTTNAITINAIKNVNVVFNIMNNVVNDIVIERKDNGNIINQYFLTHDSNNQLYLLTLKHNSNTIESLSLSYESSRIKSLVTNIENKTITYTYDSYTKVINVVDSKDKSNIDIVYGSNEVSVTNEREETHTYYFDSNGHLSIFKDHHDVFSLSSFSSTKKLLTRTRPFYLDYKENLLVNGNFLNGISPWQLTNNYTYTVTDESENYLSFPNKSLLLVQDISSFEGIYQDINISGYASDRFTLFLFTKLTNFLTSTKAVLEVYYYSELKESIEVNISADSLKLAPKAYEFKVSYAYTKIRLYILNKSNKILSFLSGIRVSDIRFIRGGLIEKHTYDEDGYLLKSIKGGKDINYSYYPRTSDRVSNIASVTTNTFSTTIDELDERGNFLEVSYNVDKHIHISKDERGNVLSNKMFSNNEVLCTYNSYTNIGLLISKEDVNGRVSNYSYSSLLKISEVTFNDELTNVYTYSNKGLLEKITFKASNTSLIENNIAYSASYKISQIYTSLNAYTYRQYSYTYNDNELLSEVGFVPSSDINIRSTDYSLESYEYESISTSFPRYVSKKKYGNNTYSFIYGDNGEKLNSIKYNFTPKYSFLYDDFDRLIGVNNNELSINKTYTYNDLSSLNEVEDRESVINYYYDNENSSYAYKEKLTNTINHTYINMNNYDALSNKSELIHALERIESVYVASFARRKENADGVTNSLIPHIYNYASKDLKLISVVGDYYNDTTFPFTMARIVGVYGNGFTVYSNLESQSKFSVGGFIYLEQTQKSILINLIDNTHFIKLGVNSSQKLILIYDDVNEFTTSLTFPLLKLIHFQADFDLNNKTINIKLEDETATLAINTLPETFSLSSILIKNNISGNVVSPGFIAFLYFNDDNAFINEDKTNFIIDTVNLLIGTAGSNNITHKTFIPYTSTFGSYERYTLNGSFNSLTGKGVFHRSDDNKLPPFIYDDELKSLAYAPRSNSKLIIKSNMSANGTIVIRFKLLSNEEGGTIFELSSYLTSSLMRLYVSNNALYIDKIGTISCVASSLPTGWNTCILSYSYLRLNFGDITSSISFDIYVNDTEITDSFSYPSTPLSQYISVGNSINGNDYFAGLLSDLCYASTSIGLLFSIDQFYDEYYKKIISLSKSDKLNRKSEDVIISNNEELINKTYSYRNVGQYFNNITRTSNEVSSLVTSITGSSSKNDYLTYNNLGLISAHTTYGYTNNIMHTYTYDNFLRLTSVKNYNSNSNYYEYDIHNNITKIVNGSTTFELVYDSYNRLLSCGNDTYEYNNTDPFLITKINKSNGSINLSYMGRRLISYIDSNNTITFNYDEMSRRIRKTSNGVSKDYYYHDDRLIATKKGGVYVYYIYDNNNQVIGFIYNSSYYFYIRDITGTIKEIIDNTGIVRYAYTYTPYGKIISQSASSSEYDWIGSVNDFVYKGYVYDEETQLYWVSSRYYSPELCRWISPDSIEYLDLESINGLNLYAYCNNDPVNYYDPTGHSAILIGLIIGAIVGAGIGFGTVAYTDYQDDGQIFNGSVKWYEYVGGTVTGAVLGAGVGGIIGAGGAVLSSALVSTGNKFISDLFAYTLTGTPFGTWEDYAVAFISGGLIKGLGMKGIVKTAYDVALRPAINQVVKIGTNRTETFNVDKYAYDVVTRGLTTFAPSPWKAFYRGGFRSMWDLYKRGYFA